MKDLLEALLLAQCGSTLGSGHMGACNIENSLSMLAQIAGAAERQTAYEDAVLQQLLGAEYIQTGLPCQLSTEFAAGLSAQLQSAERSLSCKACLLPDHTIFRQRADSKRHCAESSARGLAGEATGAVRHGMGNGEAGGVSTGMHDAGTLCVEIKPKCGFLPTSKLIKPEHQVKRRVPRFLLHQRLKLAQVCAHAPG